MPPDPLNVLAPHGPKRRAPTTAQNERYTTTKTLELVKKLAGVNTFTLDVAGCVESHKAPKWYGWQDKARTPSLFLDGLKLPWGSTKSGMAALATVFCNPPFTEMEAWAAKAWEEIAKTNGPALIAMLSPANRTEQPWWHQLIEAKRDKRMRGSPLGETLTTRFLPGRTRYGCMADPEGLEAGSPPFGSVLLLWRR